MINLLTVHDKAVNKVYFLYIIIFSLNLISLIFMTIIYCINAYSFQYLEEDDPNIDLTGISKFTFDSGDIPEYNPGQPNLGNTGKFIVILVNALIVKVIVVLFKNALEKVKIENAMMLKVHVQPLQRGLNMVAQMNVD